MEDYVPLRLEIDELVERMGTPPDLRPQGETQPEYVITRGGEEWDRIRIEFMAAQGNRCAICLEPFKDLPHVDHCHRSGLIRGALCNSCNIKLGWYEKRRREIESYLARAAQSIAYRAAPRIPRFFKRPRTKRPQPAHRLPNGRTQAQDNALKQRWATKAT